MDMVRVMVLINDTCRMLLQLVVLSIGYPVDALESLDCGHTPPPKGPLSALQDLISLVRGTIPPLWTIESSSSHLVRHFHHGSDRISVGCLLAAIAGGLQVHSR